MNKATAAGILSCSFVLLGVLAAPSVSQSPADQPKQPATESTPNKPQQRPAPLFDGKSFKGWEGDLDAFRIEDGAIVGGSLKRPVPKNEYLCTTRQYADFELRLKFKILGESVNAGIQIRSYRVPKSNEMIGYQADLGKGIWGNLYDERRHKLLVGPTEAQQAKFIKPDGWNEYLIRCQDRRVQFWINGHQTVDYTEPDRSIPQVGVIGLQIHQGLPAEAWYKDLTILELPPPK